MEEINQVGMVEATIAPNNVDGLIDTAAVANPVGDVVATSTTVASYAENLTSTGDLAEEPIDDLAVATAEDLGVDAAVTTLVGLVTNSTSSNNVVTDGGITSPNNNSSSSSGGGASGNPSPDSGDTRLYDPDDPNLSHGDPDVHDFVYDPEPVYDPKPEVKIKVEDASSDEEGHFNDSAVRSGENNWKNKLQNNKDGLFDTDSEDDGDDDDSDVLDCTTKQGTNVKSNKDGDKDSDEESDNEPPAILQYCRRPTLFDDEACEDNEPEEEDDDQDYSDV